MKIDPYKPDFAKVADMHQITDSGIYCEEKRQIAATDKDAQLQWLILASNSPRRKELLELAGYSFMIEVAEVNETAIFNESLTKHRDRAEAVQVAIATRTVAEEKALAVWVEKQKEDLVILAADTIVYDGQTVLGKPRDEAEALEMLKDLSGQVHQVMTAVAIISSGMLQSFVSVTNVSFYPWDQDQERAVLASIHNGSALDKAGAYGIQASAVLLVREIQGDYNTVVGLPLAEVYRRLAASGVFPKPLTK